MKGEQIYGIIFKICKKEETIYDDDDIVALADAKTIPASEVGDEMFSQEMLGQTVAFVLQEKTVISPANGILEVMYPTGHAFAVRMENGTGILVHVGIDTVNLKGKGFRVFAKQGDRVKAGQKILEVDSDVIREAGYDPTTMLVITEQAEEGKTVDFIAYGEVNKKMLLDEIRGWMI